MHKIIKVKGEEYKTPIFCPDATRGVIRSADQKDLLDANVNGLVVNTYHLLSQPGIEVLKSVGGIKKLMSWDKLIISDSGGFQIFSLIHKNKSLGKITEDGVKFYLNTKGEKKKYFITPEECIKIQFEIGSDIMIVLDYFTQYKADKWETQKSVETTTAWAKRCKEEFQRQCESRGMNDGTRPLLFAVIQGGNDLEMRQRSADELTEIGFDGYGLGGWTFDDEGKFDLKLVEQIAKMMPDDKFKYALGVGNPQNIIDCISYGYDIFDCVLPTRDARHQRLYIMEPKGDEFYSYIYISRSIYANDNAPISKNCECYACKNYSRAYINHLFKIGDSLAFRLATIHNLFFYSQLTLKTQQEL